MNGNRAATVRKAKSAPGSTGVISYGGFVDTGERDRELIGSRKWVTYSNAFSRPPVAIAAILRYALMSGARWSLVENKAGGRDAARGVEIVHDGLFDARLEGGDTWPEIVGKAGMSWFNGSSLHAFAMARRKDGLVTFSDISHRPMDTIDKWLRSADNRPFDAVEQLTRDGKRATIPLAQCLYVVERMLSDDPYGVGVLRLVVERIRRTGRYEALEGSELFSSLGGLPIARAPLGEINEQLSSLPDDQKQARKQELTAPITTVVSERIKTPEKQQYAVLASDTYQGSDPNTISTVKKWDIEIVKGELQGLVEIRKVITDLDLDVARILGVEFVFVGGGDSAGTYGMHESKVGLFQSTLQASLDRIAVRARDQLARRLVAANGLDPDTATPALVPEKITITAVLDAVAALEGLSRAGLHPKDPARNMIRERLELPPEPDEAIEAELMAPRVTIPPDDDEGDVDDLDDDDPAPEDIEPKKPEEIDEP